MSAPTCPDCHTDACKRPLYPRDPERLADCLRFQLESARADVRAAVERAKRAEATIEAVRAAANEPDAETQAVIDGGMRLDGNRGYYIGLAAVLKSSLMHVRALLDAARAKE